MVVGEGPLSHNSSSGHVQEPGSKASLECRGVTVDPDVAHCRVDCNLRVGSLIQIVRRSHRTQRRNYLLGVLQVLPLFLGQLLLLFHQYIDPTHSATQQQQDVEDYGAIDSSDLIEDAKFYQDAAIEYQNT